LFSHWNTKKRGEGESWAENLKLAWQNRIKLMNLLLQCDWQCVFCVHTTS
jgi:hypothetical protein